MKIQPTDALIVVDLQNDFVSGTLAVPGAQDILPRIWVLVNNGFVYNLQVWSADHHISAHPSFQEQGGPWPSHCVQQTWGADFVMGPPQGTHVYTTLKGQWKEAYSAFEADDLHGYLSLGRLRRLFICGLATDYCVRATALDAIKLGYDVYLIQDCVAGVEFETTADALLEMVRAGVRLIDSTELT